MKIVLIRHGEPSVDLNRMLRARYSSRSLEELNRIYAASGINRNHRPTRQTIELIKSCNAVVCSDLPRSVESALVLEADNIHSTDPLFREAGLPYASLNRPSLPLFTWFILYRSLWFLGYSKNGTSISQARQQARQGTLKLIQLAEEHGSVALIGHGFVNRFIAGYLRSSGWHGPKTPGGRYWGYGVYEIG